MNKEQKNKRLDQAFAWLKNNTQLSSREMNIVRLISYGFSKKEIADILCISEHTVSSHLKNIYAAMGIHKDTELTRWYVMKCHQIKELSMFLDFSLIYLIIKILSL